MSRAFPIVCASLLAAVTLAAQGQQAPDQKTDQKTDPQRPPTFRTGAHFVSVDAYPTGPDGKPLAGLRLEDFELLEDNRPQTLDRIEFILHPEWTPLAERRDPNSQRDGFALARDPGYRIFVLYLDAYHVQFGGSHRSAVPISETLDRMIGPRDLVGMLTPAQTIKDLMLGQLTQGLQEQLNRNPDWGLAGMERSKPEPGEPELEAAYPAEAPRLIALRRLDKVYSDLESLIALLSDLRDERKNIIFFSDYFASPPLRRGDMTNGDGTRGTPPRIGTSPEGTLSIGDRNAAEPNRTAMSAERQRLISIDFSLRFRDLLRQARQGNVAFYTVRPGGLDANVSMMDDGLSNLQVLAEQTDGIAVLNTNDIRTGMMKIANDFSSHYVLGYYTSNSKWDGGTRRITVRLKATGRSIRARREYRAPTEAEMSGLRTSTAAAAAAAAPPPPTQMALSALTRVNPSSRLNGYGTVIGNQVTVVAEIAAAEIEAGRWKQGADVEVLFSSKDGGEPVTLKGRIEPGTRSTTVTVPADSKPGPWQAIVRTKGEDNITDSDTVAIERPAGALLGKPLAYRAASAAASAYKPLAAFQFRRTERVRVEWPVSQPLESHQARLLDRAGKPIAIPMETATREANGATLLTTNLNLAPFSNGDYLIEITAKAGEKSETQLLAIRVSMAR